jgi:hypothetical protein
MPLDDSDLKNIEEMKKFIRDNKLEGKEILKKKEIDYYPVVCTAWALDKLGLSAIDLNPAVLFGIVCEELEWLRKRKSSKKSSKKKYRR